jgi:hypothetical protein
MSASAVRGPPGSRCRGTRHCRGPCTGPWLPRVPRVKCRTRRPSRTSLREDSQTRPSQCQNPKRFRAGPARSRESSESRAVAQVDRRRTRFRLPTPCVRIVSLVRPRTPGSRDCPRPEPSLTRNRRDAFPRIGFGLPSGHRRPHRGCPRGSPQPSRMVGRNPPAETLIPASPGLVSPARASFTRHHIQSRWSGQPLPRSP